MVACFAQLVARLLQHLLETAAQVAVAVGEEWHLPQLHEETAVLVLLLMVAAV
jgi:hypothetical protein